MLVQYKMPPLILLLCSITVFIVQSSILCYVNKQMHVMRVFYDITHGRNAILAALAAWLLGGRMLNLAELPSSQGRGCASALVIFISQLMGRANANRSEALFRKKSLSTLFSTCLYSSSSSNRRILRTHIIKQFLIERAAD